MNEGNDKEEDYRKQPCNQGNGADTVLRPFIPLLAGSSLRFPSLLPSSERASGGEGRGEGRSDQGRRDKSGIGERKSEGRSDRDEERVRRALNEGNKSVATWKPSE